MNKETADMLFDQAVDLAYTHFEEPTDEHIEWIFDRLALNYRWGSGNDGATTVH